MYSIDNFNISMPHGDSAVIPFVFYTDDEGAEAPYMLKEGQYALLTISAYRGAPAVLSVRVEAEAQDEKGTCFFEILPEASAELPTGEYFYTLSLHNADESEVDTWVGFPESATFTIE